MINLKYVNDSLIKASMLNMLLDIRKILIFTLTKIMYCYNKYTSISCYCHTLFKV